ncbi:MAG: S9 family peptidase [Sphingomonas sp.]|uniref:alpha/beta hydrolase family protein n=1 Tax=Sphingomonas sp. TaxID=28214 RepID=UPI0025F8E041|nr:S9 family peptidase [Sphingomonas sp.]MBX3565655.1 S9 family peptidase [Sphingomonas sp.]
MDPALYFSEPVLSEPLLSPDGGRIAARAMVGGEARLAVFQADKGMADPQPVALPRTEQLQWYRWIDGHSLLVSLLLQGSAPTSRLVAVDLTSGALRQLGAPRPAGANDAILHIDRAGTFMLLKSQADERTPPSVYRIDLRTGAAALAVAPQPHVRDWMVDADGVIRAGIAAKGQRAWMLYRRQEGDRFSRASDGDAVEQLAAVRGSDTGYAMAEAPSGRTGLYAYDFRRGKLGRLIYENDQVDLDGFETGPDGRLLGVRFSGDRDETLWFDAAAAGEQEAIDAALPGRVNRVVSASDDKQRLLVLSSSASDRGIYYVYSGGRAALFGAVNPELTARPATEMRAVSYRARDGMTLHGFLTLPAGRGSAGLPLVVIPHGGPFARDDWGYDPWVQYLAAKGYAVFQPNFRGSVGYGIAYMAKGDGEWGRGMQDDMDDGVAWLAKAGTIDARRVCVMGASYGGYAAMWAAARDPDKYRCAISFAGISDVRAQLDYDRQTFAAVDFRAWRRRIQGSAPSLESLSPLSYADRIVTPMLIAHGSEDDIVPPEQSVMLHQALSRLGRTHEYAVYPGEGHNMDDPANSADFLRRVGQFLDRYNPS